MDPVIYMRTVVVFILLIQWTASDRNALNIVATCKQTTESISSGWSEVHVSNPSPLHELSVQLSESEASLIIKWLIKIDGSIHSLTGTWIELIVLDHSLYYSCQYQPPFTSEQNNLTGLQQLWFNFTASDVSVHPSAQYYIYAFNLPPPPPADTKGQFIKSSYFETPGCESKQMSNHPWCSTDKWDAGIFSVFHDDKIVVTFTTSSASEIYTIRLRKGTHILQTKEINGGGKVQNHTEEVKYTGTCEELLISITPQFQHCLDGCSSVHHKVSCPNADRSGLVIGIGCVLLFLLILLCCCILRQIHVSRHGSKRTVSMRVLVVYPAVDSMFQHAVMVLAEFLHSVPGVHVIIDMWERGSLAEHGPLRWLNSQSDLAQRVLIILPPQYTHTDNLKPNAATNHTVSASANNLFALVLNLVTSTAHDPQQWEKFWIIHLDQNKDKRKMPAELRGCRIFHLPEDLLKLHEKLSSGADMKSSALSKCLSIFKINDASWRVLEALQQLDINTNSPACAKVNSLEES
ncbi:interleukin-17 receptor B isoform X1 [Myxocyprinus asiaticus]|uniref:interleukin-17 receptor B isoform X1 n=1 Tax=Myxocyprinus asiaticus TaxID=70543 RepID=UPI002222BD12|nr:interleukin-17 receptor B isoform X1 [Myxocyprinus asiaticus]